MGLTIHYTISVPDKWSPPAVREKLEALRQACMDLPVEKVSELQEFKGDDCQAGEKGVDPFRWAKTQAARHLDYPWEPGYFRFQSPHHMLVFAVNVAPGCEPMNIGTCAFPPCIFPKREVDASGQLSKPTWSQAVTVAHHYPAAARILKQFVKRWRLHRLPWSADYPRSQENLLYQEFCRVCIVQGRYMSHRRGYAPPWVLIELQDRDKRHIRWRFKGTIDEARATFASTEFKGDMERLLRGEKHTVPGDTGAWKSFCKTQYASEHGLPNFLRAHMTVCAILEKAQDLGFKLTVDDDSGFWTKRDVKALTEIVGQWDQMIAAIFGSMKDAMPGEALESPMQNRADFEHLEMKATQAGYGIVAGKIAEYLAKLKLPKPESE